MSKSEETSFYWDALGGQAGRRREVVLVCSWRALLCSTVGLQAGARRDGQPVAFRWRAIGRLVPVDQAKSGLPFAVGDVKPDSAAVHKLGMKAASH